MRVLKAGGLYFALVFAAGFALGTFRVLWFVPRVGERTAELLEAPIMLMVAYFVARWVVRRMALPDGMTARLETGLAALGLMVGAELLVVLVVRGLTLRAYVASRDPVSGIVYVLTLVIFALVPLFVARG
jgi:hypothetical protein